jgi:hypothetical protein
MTGTSASENLVASMLEGGEPAVQYRVIALTEEHSTHFPIHLGSFVASDHRNALTVATAMLFLDDEHNWIDRNPILKHLNYTYKLTHLRLQMLQDEEPEREDYGTNWWDVFEWSCRNMIYLTPEFIDFEPFSYEIGKTSKNLYCYVEFGSATQFLDIMTNNFPNIEVDYIDGVKKDGMQYYYLSLPAGVDPVRSVIESIEMHLDRGY